MFTIHTSLSQDLEILRITDKSFDEVAEILFQYSYEDFNLIFEIEKIQVSAETYQRIPVYKGNCVCFLMIWGANNKTAIHDHKNYNGKIKILKGNLTEISYKETFDFIEYDSEGVAPEGASFDEDYGGIHSIVNNNSEDIAVSLHIYNTPQTSLEGVRIFDLEHKKVAFLTDKAPSCSWNLPEECFQKTIYS